MPVSYIEELPVTTLDAAGARTIYVSGKDTVVTRCSRAILRRYCETTLRQLNEYEREESERSVVVSMQGWGGRH